MRTRSHISAVVAVVALAVTGCGSDEKSGDSISDALFPAPPDTVQVPSIVGMTEEKARTELGGAGFEVDDNSIAVNSTKVAEGRVISQDPGGDEYVAPDTVITLTVSIGPA